MLQLAHHVQSFLHKHNIPRLSFYDQMMTNKREEQRRIEAAEKERLREQMEASKEQEEEEVVEIVEYVRIFSGIIFLK